MRDLPASQRSYISTNCAESSSRQPTVSPLMCGDTIRRGTCHNGLSGGSGSVAGKALELPGYSASGEAIVRDRLSGLGYIG